MKVANIDYSGKKVFVGMDVHKKTYAIAAISDGEIVKKWTTKADPIAVASRCEEVEQRRALTRGREHVEGSVMINQLRNRVCGAHLMTTNR